MPYQSVTIYNVLFPVYFIVMASHSTSSPSEDNTSGTDLSIIPTKDEKQIDTTAWTTAKCKKLQHMVEFHKEYQCVFGESIYSYYNEKQDHSHESSYA